MQPDLAAFVHAATGCGVTIAGGLEPAVRDYPHMDRDTAFAAASSHLEQGARALYLSNHDCHRTQGRLQPYTDDEMEILRHIGHPQRYARSSKLYVVTPDMGGE